jgi:heme exporter protein A
MIKKYTLESIGISYAVSSRALFKNINFSLQQGQIANIYGGNGSGKTTLLRMIAGLIEPHDGKILWCDKKISIDRMQYQQNMRYLGHQTGLKPGLTVHENLQLDCLLSQQNANMGDNEAFGHLGINPIRNVLSEQLSAGQAKRVALASVTNAGVPLWIIDEPYTHLDQDGVRTVDQLILNHVKQGGLTMIATHALAEGLKHADVQGIALS